MSVELQAALRERARQAFPTSAGMSGRGIVTCAGGALHFTCVYVLIRLLRETLGCTLPIQVWHLGGEELSPLMRHLLVGLGVELVDAAGVLTRHPANIRDGWQLKAYAVAYSRFEEVLFLDADQAPVRDPRFLFGTPEYIAAGAVFWPDIIEIRAESPIWALTGLEAVRCRSWESGQMLVDKRRHWSALQVALLLNERADVVYELIYGDKDTFLLAWRLTGDAVALVPHLPFQDERVLIQRDFQGAPLFQHLCNSKWSYHETQYELAGFQHMDACLAYLEDLRGVWNGRMFFAPDRSPAARLEEDRLAGGEGGFRLILIGMETLVLELLEGHQIGAGRAMDRQNWHVTETEAGLQLILHDGDQDTYRLSRVSDSRWVGERLIFPRTAVQLDVSAALPQSPTTSASFGGLLDAVVDASGILATDDVEADAALLGALCVLVRAEPRLLDALDDLGRRSPRLAGVATAVAAVVGSRAIRPTKRSSHVFWRSSTYLG